ncbi:MAG: ethanolamine permease [Polyangiales bacterium]
MSEAPAAQAHMRKVLTPLHLWGIAVGLVISGDYFGWNYGVEKGGALGMLAATLLMSALYVCFIFSYTELSTAMPRSGGPSTYAARAFGRWGGFLAGYATLVEFLLAPPAIARAVGSYVHFRVPSLSVEGVAVGAFAVFCALNALGTSLAATFELVVTLAATFELVLFFFLAAPHASMARLTAAPTLPHGLAGVLAAVPFAIWFFLGIEGVAMSAEEARDPRRDIPRGYVAGVLTLVVLAVGTLLCSAGVLTPTELVADDSPLPRVLARVLSPSHPMTHLMVYLGLFGLIASFHGILMGAARQVFALARDGYLPGYFAALHPRFRAPARAVLVPWALGTAAVFSGRTDDLITAAVLGAVALYLISMAALFRLRRSDPEMERPFRVPGFPWVPGAAMGLSALSLLAVAASAPRVTAGFVALGAILAVIQAKRFRARDLEHS